MIRIKVCGMKDPLNAKLTAESNPDYLGFIFYPKSPRYVGEEPDMSLFRNIPPGIIKAGVFVNEDPARILETTGRSGLNMVQLHGDESPGYCSYLKSSGLIIVKSFNIKDDFDFDTVRSYMKYCDYFLFDTESDRHGGTGKKFNWYKLSGYDLEKPFFLSGGIGPEDGELINTLENRGLFAIDINSRFEISPGIKDVTMVKIFIDKIKKTGRDGL